MSAPMTRRNARPVGGDSVPLAGAASVAAVPLSLEPLVVLTSCDKRTSSVGHR